MTVAEPTEERILQAVIQIPTETHKNGNPYTEARAIQHLIIRRLGNPKVTDASLAQLARAWDVLEERKRILRGRPLPGQLRPDLDPVQLAKATRRQRARGIGPIVDIASKAGANSFDDGAAGPAATATATPQPGEAPKAGEQAADKTRVADGEKR